jgi:hypothetical protein
VGELCVGVGVITDAEAFCSEQVIRMTKPSGNAGDTEKNNNNNVKGEADTIILPEISFSRSLKLTPFRPGRPVNLIKSRL